MRLYGRQFVSRAIHKRISVKTETRDGVLWDIDWANRICKVKIQGSNEQLAAHFPQNEAVHPSFMKEGNAVRIVHRGGVRGFFEVVGHGMTIPTPVPGNPVHPTTSDLADVILTGCELTAADTGNFDVTISDGTYRINGVTYSISGGTFGKYMNTVDPMVMHAIYPPAVMGDTGTYILMEDPSNYTMNDLEPPMILNETEVFFTLDDPPSGNKLRYDAFYVGTDGNIIYLKGASASSNPTKPSIPANNVQIGQYILLWTGMGSVSNENIGQDYTTKTPSDIEITAIDEFSWSAVTDTPETDVKVEVIDQYGWAISKIYTITLSMLKGSGHVWSSTTGYHTSTVSRQFTGTSYTFKYRRDQTKLETSPYLSIEVAGYGIVGFDQITLLDQWGNEVTGNQSHDVQYLTSAAAVEIDWSEGSNAVIEIEEDVTFTFTGTPDLERIILRVRQDSTGGWSITLPANVRYGTQITAASISTAVNSVSYLGFLYDADDEKYDLVANVTGYS